MIPSWRAALPITRAASRSSSALWLAIAVSRSRELPAGTVGGRTACANTPPSSARSQSAIARRGSPTITGTIWVREPPVLSPWASSPSRRTAALRRSCSTSPGRSTSSSSAASAAPVDGGGSAVEKMNGRAVLTSSSTISAEPQT